MTKREMEMQINALQQQVRWLSQQVMCMRQVAGREMAITEIISEGYQAGQLSDLFAFGLTGTDSGSDPEYAGQLCLKRDLWMVDETGVAARVNLVLNEFYGDDAGTPVFVAGWSW